MELILVISTLLSVNARIMTRVKDFLMSLDCTEEVAEHIETLQHGAGACKTMAEKMNVMLLDHLKNE